MREGWTYMKLGEVCNIRTGKLNANAMVEDGEYPFFTCDSNPYRIDKYAFDTEAILISGNGSLVGHVNYYKGKFNAYQRTYVLDNFSHFHIPYLLTFLKGYLRPYIKRNFKGGCIPYITLPILQSFSIPLPPKSQQEAIVSELDEINSLLALKREQLQKYDKLAQSLFYEMFGDPVENEKGWEVKKFGDVLKSATKGPFGSDIKKSLYVPKSETSYKVYVQVNAISKDVTLGDYYISKEYFDQKMYKFEVAPDDYLITCDGTMGKFVRLPQNIERGIISASLLRLTLNNQIVSYYFEYLWDLLMLPYLLTQVRNAALQHLPAASKISQVEIPLPPLPLQQQFASRIEQIEEQKQQVQAAIEKLETLLASRMQYWFD